MTAPEPRMEAAGPARPAISVDQTKLRWRRVTARQGLRLVPAAVSVWLVAV